MKKRGEKVTQEVATIKPYGPPYCEQRAWDLGDFEDWERELLVAVKTSGVHALEDEIAKLEDPFSDMDEDWLWKPYGKGRAFAIDYHTDIVIESLKRVGDGRLQPKESTPLRGWRKQRMARFKRFDPGVSAEEIDLWDNWEEAVIKEIVHAFEHHDLELEKPFLRWGISTESVRKADG